MFFTYRNLDRSTQCVLSEVYSYAVLVEADRCYFDQDVLQNRVIGVANDCTVRGSNSGRIKKFAVPQKFHTLSGAHSACFPGLKRSKREADYLYIGCIVKHLKNVFPQ